MPTEPSPQMMLFDVDRPSRSGRATYGQMLDVQPPARSMDPVGSHQAAEKMHDTGIGGRQRRAVFMSLRAHQGATSRELAHHMGCDDRMVTARRLPELESCGWVCRGRRRKCRISGIESVTWFVARKWIDQPKPQTGAQVPCESKQGGQAGPEPASAATGQAEGNTARPHGQTAGTPGLGPIPSNVTTPDERRAIRERLRTSASPEVQRFLDGLRGEGGLQ